jgi:hypothetical protein
MADLIVVDLDYVSHLRQQVGSTTDRLREDSPDNVSLPSDPETDDELHEFMQKWDKRRGELADTLAAVADALTAIHDAFDGTDNQLTGQITCQ